MILGKRWDGFVGQLVSNNEIELSFIGFDARVLGPRE